MKAIYNAIVNNWWRYTFDPKGAEVLTIDPEKIYEITLGRGIPNHSGYGDCDDIAVASGALLASIGFDVRIATTVKPKSPFIFDHVFVFAKAQNGPWVCFDPVLFPRAGFGDITKFKRIALWDLKGNLISKRGPFPPRFDAVMSLFGSVQPAAPQFLTGTESLVKMQTQQNPNFYQFPDYADSIGFFGADDVLPENEIGRLTRDDVLPDFAKHGILGFGAYSGIMGTLTGEQVPTVMAEYDGTDEIGNTGYVRTKHFEMAPDDYTFAKINGVPPMGALALADDGEVYQWAANPEGIGGFFKKLFKKAKKKVRKLAKKAKKFVKKIVTKLPLGKTMWKIGSKIHKTAMKIAKPLLKVIGPIAKKIAPVAALIPGIGPAVSAGLMITGKVYDVAKKYGVKFDKNKRPIIKSKSQGRAFATALAKQGQKMGKRGAKAAIAAYRRKKGMGRKRSLINPGFFGDADVYATPDVNITSRMPAYHGIGWA